MKILGNARLGKLVPVFNVLMVILLVGLLLSVNYSAVVADDAPDRTPTYGSTHGTASADELVSAMDIPDEFLISTSLARASSVEQPVLNFPLDTATRVWMLTQGANNAYSHTGDSAFALDFSDTVFEDGAQKELTGVEDVPVFAAAGGVIDDFKWDVTEINRPVAEKKTGNFIRINHGNKFTTGYLHLQYNSIPDSLRTKGAQVTPGQFLGLMGQTGSADGIHLHFVVKHNYGGSSESAILDKTRVAGRLINDFVTGSFYPDTGDFSDKTGTHVFNYAVSNFPISGSKFAVLSSGNAIDAVRPNTEGNLSTQLGGINTSQGYDLVQLSVTLAVPIGATGWAVDWKFLSEEYPEWVGSSYNDTFLIETPLSDYTISGNTVQATHNVALDPDGHLVSVNTTGVVGMSTTNSLGTTYDGGTATLTTSAPILFGKDIITLVFSVMDLGDPIYDTTVFLDNFRFITPNYIEPLQTHSFYASVPPDQIQCIFSTIWTGSDIVMSLTDPSGRLIGRDTLDPDIMHELGSNWESYTISNPTAGNWQVHLFAADVPPAGENVTFLLRFSSAPVPPMVELASGGTIYADQVFTGSGYFVDSDSASWTATVDYGDGTGLQELSLKTNKTFNLSHVYHTAGNYQITVFVTDDTGLIGSGTIPVTAGLVSNVPALSGPWLLVYSLLFAVSIIWVIKRRQVVKLK